MAHIADIEGIGAAYAQTLAEKGVTTTEALLEKCATPAGRKALAEETAISGKLILKWANRADLARIKGIGSEYADLLEAAGVDTVPALARRNAANLYASLTSTNEEKKLTRRPPSESQVADWIEQAKALPRKLTY
jgi:predicted flap endonuclease-1-like 5' DNA nuclease